MYIIAENIIAEKHQEKIMRIQYASDLHVEFDSKPLRRNHLKGDVLVLAGDIAGSPRQLVRYLQFLHSPVPVFLVLGNHEFYGHPWERATDLYRIALEREMPHVRLLERESVVHNGVRILGTALWTDFFGGVQGPVSEEKMLDFQKIRTMDGEPLRWKTVMQEFEVSRSWLQAELEKPFSGKTVVLTHHPPSLLSNDPSFLDSPVSGAFCNRLDDLVEKTCPDVWIHGHTHNTSDYLIGGTRILCNPYGYRGIEINPDWKEESMVEVGE